MSKHLREALTDLNDDVSRDVKLDDKSGCVELADKNDFLADTDEVKKEIEFMLFSVFTLCILYTIRIRNGNTRFVYFNCVI